MPAEVRIPMPAFFRLAYCHDGGIAEHTYFHVVQFERLMRAGLYIFNGAKTPRASFLEKAVIAALKLSPSSGCSALKIARIE